MFFLTIESESTRQSHIESMDVLREIKSGNSALREDFILKNIPFIKKTVAGITGKYKNLEDKDEFSIGLLAFNEAIDKYDESRNDRFLSFCSMVIKSRILDYIRRNSKHGISLPFSYFENYDGVSCIEADIGFCHKQMDDMIEIGLFKAKLLGFGITIEKLVKTAPKHKDTRFTYLTAARVIALDRQLFNKMDGQYVYPKTEISRLTNINLKALERNRSFIIAAVLIIGNGFDSLRRFIELPDVDMGGESVE